MLFLLILLYYMSVWPAFTHLNKKQWVFRKWCLTSTLVTLDRFPVPQAITLGNVRMKSQERSLSSRTFWSKVTPPVEMQGYKKNKQTRIFWMWSNSLYPFLKWMLFKKAHVRHPTLFPLFRRGNITNTLGNLMNGKCPDSNVTHCAT